MNGDEIEQVKTMTEVANIEMALHEFSSLSKPEYLREIQNKSSPVLKCNNKLVSNVVIRNRKLLWRSAPYTIIRPHRVRTKSENNDAPSDSSTNIAQSVLDDATRDLEDCILQLKKAKSLESIVNSGDNEFIFKVPEMENVSDRIEKLKVGE